jgi:gliding motility-associated-like protein
MRYFILVLFLSFFIKTTYSQTLKADFTATPTSVCEGDPITFKNTSTGSNISTYTWNFGNGETSTDQNPVYTYPSPGVYTVTLAIQTTGGQADAKVKAGYITVNPKPDPKFTMNGNSCTVPINVTFNNTTNPTAGINFSWNFGNGQNSTQTQPSPVIYSAAGSYTVTLKATNATTGCTKTYTQNVNISNFQADFTTPTVVCAGSPIQLTDNSSAGANVWLWNAGAAGTSSQQNPIFTFATAGTYTVSLSSANSVSGCNASVTKTITVINSTKPTFTSNDTKGCAPVSINFQNTTGATGTYTWNFGDGQSYSGQTPPPHTYSANGSYNVTLVLKDQNGCVDSIKKTAYVVVSNIKANFSAVPVSGCTPLNVVFTNASTTPSTTTSPITSYQWTFGNGQTSTSATPPTQTYTEGKYDVTLIVQSANGCKDTLKKVQYIKVGSKQHADFTYNPANVCVKKDVQFTNTSTIKPGVDTTEVTWNWDFGGDGNSTQKNPKHQFTKDTGYFDVTLVVDYRGCKDTMKKTDIIYIKAPISQYYLQKSLFCNPTSFPVTVQTKDTSKLGIATDLIDVYWKWGDNSQTHIPNSDLHDADKSSTTHSYSTYGAYTVWQIIENHTTGCKDSTSKVVNISKIDAGMTLIDSICKSSQLTIDGSSATSTDAITTWSYTMGNGQTATGNPATYTYNTAGTYTIKQTVTNSVGCTATTTKNPFTVLELPKADFTVVPVTNCAPSQVTVTNTSTKQGNGVNLLSFDWTNMDNNVTQSTTSLGSSPTMYFNGAGTHNIQLVVTDKFGCKSAPLTKSFDLTKPKAQFTIDSIICNGINTTTTNTSTGAPTMTYKWLVDNQNAGTSSELTYKFGDNANSTSVTHQVGLIAIDVNGCKDTMYRTVKVSLPKAKFGYVASAASVNQDGSFTCPPVFMQYTDSSQSIGSVTNWKWDFHDNGNMSTQKNPSNTFVFPGTYSTTLIITDEFGCKDTLTKTDILVIHGPKADPKFMQSPDKCGQMVTFTLGQNSDVVHVDWNFGDGVHQYDTANYTYPYVSAGTYNPSVTIKDASNCEVIYLLDPIIITPNSIVAHFTYSPSEIEYGNTVTFTDNSSSSVAAIVKWDWTIYDNNYVNATNGSINEYMGIPGYHDVTLIVSDQYGCMAKYTETIFVKPKIQLPNVFTPNGDGVNDYFTLDNDFYKEYTIVIVNRWGNVVYTNENQQGMVIWDGKSMEGKQCIDGVYFYKFSGLLKDEKTKVSTEGFVHILGVK